jgi:predicted nucleotidyltransferase component of viral defense system
MLQKQTLPEHSLELLKRISPRLTDLGFYLAGETGLALRFGHRISVDLDFFKSDEFDVSKLSEFIKESNVEYELINETKGSLSVIAGNTKLEFLRYSYPLLESVEQIDGIPFSSLPDNAAMKLSALMNRGSKKDFFDVVELISHFTLDELFDFFFRKFPNVNQFALVKSLTWFEDADNDPEPEMLNGQTWEQVKDSIRKEVSAI